MLDKFARQDWVALGDSARDAKKWDIAARFYRKALDRNPRNPPIWVQYGHALKESGNLSDAERAYRRSLADDPTVADSHLQLGHALKLSGKTEDAKAAYLRAFILDPSLPYPLRELTEFGWSDREITELTGLAEGGIVSTLNTKLAPHRSGGERIARRERQAKTTPRPLFSVIIPIHSRTTEFREALDSVLAQTLASFEIIIVTNGSPPETLAIIEEYQADNRVRAFFYSDNSGQACRGRNRGIIEARGEFVSFLDSDDLYYEDTLANAYEAFRQTGADFVAGRASWIVDGSRILGEMRTGDTNTRCDINMAVLMRDNPFMTCTVHIRRDVLLKFGGFRTEQRYLEDLELWLRLAYRGCKFHYSDKIFAQYRLHAGNTELKYIEKKEEWFQVMWQNYTKPFFYWGI